METKQKEADTLAQLKEKINETFQQIEILKENLALELKQHEEKKLLLEKEIKSMAEVRVKWSTIIKINVGGTKFSTTQSSLIQYPSSMLAAMFSGRHNLVMDEEGSVFIDRDGSLFQHVLSFLRMGEDWEPPLDETLIRGLQKEFAYYGLPEKWKHIPETHLFQLDFQLNGGQAFHPLVNKLGRGYEIKVLKNLTLKSVEVKMKLQGEAVVVLQDENTKQIASSSLKPFNTTWLQGTFETKLEAGNIYYLFCVLNSGSADIAFDNGNNNPRNVGDFVSIQSKYCPTIGSVSNNTYSIAVILQCVLESL